MEPSSDPAAAQSDPDKPAAPVTAPRVRMQGLKQSPVAAALWKNIPATRKTSDETPPDRQRNAKYSADFIRQRIQKPKNADVQFVEDIPDYKTNPNLRIGPLRSDMVGEPHKASPTYFAMERAAADAKARALNPKPQVVRKPEPEVKVDRYAEFRAWRPNNGEGDAKPTLLLPEPLELPIPPKPEPLKGPSPAYKVMEYRPDTALITSRFQVQNEAMMPPAPETKILSHFDFDEIRTSRTRLSTAAPEQIVVYFACKEESFELRKDFKELSHVMKRYYRHSVLQLQEELGEEGLLPECSIIMLAGIRKPLSRREIRLLTEFLEEGGKVVVLAEANSEVEIYNDFTQQFGITVMKDTVIRIDRYNQYHPQECYISDAMICPTLLKPKEDGQPGNLSILYPKGCTLDVCQNAMPLICSGLSSFPNGRPLCAIYINPNSNGKLLVLGSGSLLTDQYLGKEDNGKLLKFIIELMTSSEDLGLEPVHIDDFQLNDYNVLHETVNKSSLYRSCMLDTDEFIFPGCIDIKGTIEPTKLCSADLCQANFSYLPRVLKLYEELHLPRKPLKRFVKPRMECPMPKTKLTLFPPNFSYLDGPLLELFDLDEEFSGSKEQLGRMINKCSEDDLEYCIEMLGTILNVPESTEEDSNFGQDRSKKCKVILHKIVSELANFKCPFETFGSDTPLERLSDDDDDSMKSSLNEPPIRTGIRLCHKEYS